jgi:hypothetical protein
VSRALARIAVLASVLVAALALSGSALAAPTKPTLFPIPQNVIEGPYTVHWLPSSFDRGCYGGLYRFRLLDITTYPSVTKVDVLTSSLSRTITVVKNRKHAVIVQGAEVCSSSLVVGPADVDVFYGLNKLILQVPRDLYWEEYIPFPWPPPCDPRLWVLDDDPVIVENRTAIESSRLLETAPIGGIAIDALGEATLVNR